MKNKIFDLTGKTALISGGAGLLGCEFCKALASTGAHVIIVDIDEKSIESATKKISDAVPEAHITKEIIDITQTKSIDNGLQNVLKKCNMIDVLVNSAAIDPKFEKGSDISHHTKFTEFPLKQWEESIHVNLTGTFLLTQRVCKIMEKVGVGSIINIGSNYGLVGTDQRIYKKTFTTVQSFKPSVYSVCKAGLIGFTKYLAAYYAGTKIRVNMLTPSGVFNDHDKEFEKKYSARTILRRMSQKNEYAGAIIFLASDASSYMTGGNLVIDGGWTAI